MALYSPQPLEKPASPRSDPDARATVALGRLLDAVADGTVLRGSTDELARRLAVSARALCAALEELAALRWIVVQTEADGRLMVRWERRQYQVPVLVERRRSAP